MEKGRVRKAVEIIDFSKDVQSKKKPEKEENKIRNAQVMGSSPIGSSTEKPPLNVEFSMIGGGFYLSVLSFYFLRNASLTNN